MWKINTFVISKGFWSPIYRVMSQGCCCGFVITEEVCYARRKSSLILGCASMTSLVSQCMGTVREVSQLCPIWTEAFIPSTCNDRALVLGQVLGVGHPVLS